jgi:hypothetical protein
VSSRSELKAAVSAYSGRVCCLVGSMYYNTAEAAIVPVLADAAAAVAGDRVGGNHHRKGLPACFVARELHWGAAASLA